MWPRKASPGALSRSIGLIVLPSISCRDDLKEHYRQLLPVSVYFTAPCQLDGTVAQLAPGFLDNVQGQVNISLSEVSMLKLVPHHTKCTIVFKIPGCERDAQL